jgi:hypothetical protein
MHELPEDQLELMWSVNVKSIFQGAAIIIPQCVALP